MSKITTILEEIAVEALKLGIDLKGNLLPPMPAMQFDTLSRVLPYKLSPDVIELYTWRNGAWPEGQPYEIRLIPEYIFIPIEESVETTKKFIARSDDPQMQWKKFWFSLFTNCAGGYYAINLEPSARDFGRIISINEAFDPYPAFWSLETMLASILECYKSGAYSLDENGFIIADYESSDKIYRELNHSISPYRFEPKEEIQAELQRTKQLFKGHNKIVLLKKIKGIAAKLKIDLD